MLGIGLNYKLHAQEAGVSVESLKIVRLFNSNWFSSPCRRSLSFSPNIQVRKPRLESDIMSQGLTGNL